MYDLTSETPEIERNKFLRKSQCCKNKSEECELYGRLNRKIQETYCILLR